jgi:hypothetical protein
MSNECKDKKCRCCTTKRGERGLRGATGPAGPAGATGANGLSGRGVAVFVQVDEPTQTDFNNQYGLTEGFGQNGIVGSNQIKAGDIWIENCQ